MKHNLPLGVALSLLSALAYSSQTALIKTLAVHLPPLPVVIFIQSLMSLLFILPLIFKNGTTGAKKILTTQNIKLQFLRSIFSLSTSYLLFYAVTFIPLVNGLLLANTAPLIIPFIGYLFMSQKINHRLWIPIIIGYIGVIIVLHPDIKILNPASLLAFGAAITTASTMLIMRRLSATDAIQTTAFYFFLFSTLISGLISIAFWTPITIEIALVMVTIGVLYFTAQYLSTSALKYINAQLFASLYYANIIYAVLISLFVWSILPTTATFIGMAFIFFGGIFCIRVEHRAKNLNQGELNYAKKN